MLASLLCFESFYFSVRLKLILAWSDNFASFID